MSTKRPETHVAQQSRREKLRIQNGFQHLEDFPSNLEQLSLRPGFNSDLHQVRSVRNANMLYEPAFYSSEMVNFPTASNPLTESSRMMTMPQFASFPYSSNSASTSFHSSLEEQCEVRDLGNWRNSGLHQICDSMINYTSSSATNQSNPNPNSIFGVGINNELTGVQSSALNNPSGETVTRESQRQLGGIHPNTMQDIIRSAFISGQGSEMASLMQQTGHGVWVENGNQFFFLPNYGVQSNQLRLGNPNSCTNRTIDNSLPCKSSDERSGPRVSDSKNQGLSLSLSSNSQSAPCRSDDHQSRCGLSKDPQYSKPVRSVSNPSFNAGDSVKSLQNMVVGLPSSNIDYRNVGPLGPFTGYATILKNSDFLEPAQQLLDEIFGQCNENLMKGCDVSGEVGASTSADAVNATNESGVRAKNSSSGASPSMFHCSNANENSGDGGAGCSSRLSSRPEYQQRMAKFLYMQEEVIKRYKQHHQQIQMVVSSFESVAGLSSATPFISRALKSVSRQFRSLENAISDQLRRIRQVLGEELSAPTSGSSVATTSGKLDSNMARLRFLDQSFQKNKLIVGRTGSLEHQQHAWRPQQKGLPERAVSILRAWLFDHFLHPYPTDADKHMLAARTGLSRNQVSNWFINARVRVWKPMVEEIHMLETKGGLTRDKDNLNQNPSKNEGNFAIEVAHESRVDQPVSSNQFRWQEIGSMAMNSNVEEVGELSAVEWNQEKRSKLECHITPSMEGTLMGFVPYRRDEVEVGGVGPVSLTLGLKRDDVEVIQHQQQLGLGRHFGGHMFNDFVG